MQRGNKEKEHKYAHINKLDQLYNVENPVDYLVEDSDDEAWILNK